jgi:hypothetical protein
VETMKSLQTVEEKQWYLNKPKFYGWYTTVVDAKEIRYGTLDFVQVCSFRGPFSFPDLE